MEYFRKSLRNKSIDYRHGLFFVTSQVSWNKSLLGAIVGEKAVLNELGRAIERCWLDLPRKYPELELGEFVFMPNHFHAIVKINHRAGNKTNHLSFLMGRFKGATAYIYGKFKREGKVADIGVHLWQPDYWDDLISSDEEREALRRALAKKRPIIQVVPQGIPPESDLSPNGMLAMMLKGLRRD